METVILCFLCGNDTVKQNIEMYNIQATFVTASQKPLHIVFQHLANCIKYKLVFQNETYICGDCYKEICAYDELMLNLLSSQRRLTALLQNALTEKPVESSTSIDDQSMDIELEFEDDPSLEDAFNPNLDTKEVLVEIDDDDDDVIIEEAVDATLDSNVVIFSSNDNDSQTNESKIERKRRRLECVICGDVLKSKFLLQTHMSEAHNIKQFTCKICGVSRKDEEYLELHMNIHDGKTENECRYCPKRFSRPVNTLRHMRIHWDKKKFQCEKCGERFSLDNMLYNHRLKHEAEENPLICDICNQSFKSRKTYSHHLLIHQENRPRHHCHLCPKSFTEKYTLKMHLKTHWGDKPKCEADLIVDNLKDFSEDKEIETEEAIGILVDNDSDVMCVICNSKYEDKDSLERHLQEKHDVVLK